MKNDECMYDCLGQKIHVGDMIVTHHESRGNGRPAGVTVGMVASFTPKMVKIIVLDIREGLKPTSRTRNIYDCDCIVYCKSDANIENLTQS